MALLAKVVLVFVPLHVVAARRAHEPTTGGGWVFLAAASTFQWTWMALYGATEIAGLAFAVSGVAAIATIVELLVDTARRTVPAA